MKKIIVIGSSGAGKTYLSKRLSNSLNIGLTHIDKVYWGPEWTEPTKEEWTTRLTEMIAGESWIIDGNYTNTLDMRLGACDTVIFLDIRRTLCIWRVIRRTLRYYRRRRPDMAVDCYERFDWAFLMFIWNYPRVTRPKIVALMDEHKGSTNIIHLESPRAVKNLIRDLEAHVKSISTYATS